MNDVKSSKPLIAVAGASGFVGTHLREFLKSDYRFRALTRSHSISKQSSSDDATQWKHCDLYSLPKVTKALESCDYGIYLVHSMAPSSRLIQGNFEDMDLLLADNFIRAAETAGLKHVIYLSGLIPEVTEGLSPHLRSRLEVERVLTSRSVRVTVLRAGLIFGPGGSSFSLLINLVRRLPMMLLPYWVRSWTHSIDIVNICEAFEICLKENAFAGGIYDLGGHAPMRYRDLIIRTATLLGKKAHCLNLPFNCFALSRHWVSVFGSVPPALVGPLQESLQHDLAAKANPLQSKLSSRLITFEDSFRKSVREDGRPKGNPRRISQPIDKELIKKARKVRSVQRMPLPSGWSAAQIAHEYGRWLEGRFAGFIQVDRGDNGVVRFRAGLFGAVLLELTPTAHSIGNSRRCAFYISGGILSLPVDPPGRFEFRLFPESGCVIASIHGFSPTLPWWLYIYTQAVIHLWVMRAFGRHLAKLVDAQIINPEC